MYDRYEKICNYILMGLMVVSLLILMYLGLYNHPTGDDYYYAVTTKRVLEETGSVWKMFVAAAKGVADQYVSWQGTYSAMFLMHLPPNVFGENGYKLVTTMIITLYTGGVFYLFKPIVCGVLKGTNHMWCALSALFVLLTIQTVPFKGESFFWYNGSMYYTGYFALTMFFFGGVCRYLLIGKKYYPPILAFGAIFLAGGNYVSLLPSILIMGTIVVLLFMNRSGKIWGMVVVMLLMVGGLIISAVAPGNQIRGEGSVGNMPAYKAIVLSLWQSISYLRAWIDRWWFMTAIMVTPLFIRSYMTTRVSFRYPILVMGFIHGIFCSMSCPTFYAEGSTGPARVVAIVYYAFMLSTFVNYYYGLGWLYRQWEKKMSVNRIEKLIGLKRNVPQIVLTGAFILLMITQIISGKMAECSSMQALYVLGTGEAAAYEAEYKERIKVLQDEAVKEVVFTPYEHQPAMLYVGDFTGDVENENNIEIAKYFNKSSIKVDYLD